MTKPKVSIIIPVYNTKRYLKKCLNSIINQTLKEIEIIVVNDCSPDNPQKIINDLAKKDNRIKIIKNIKNVGVSKSRNLGLKIATGEFIGFVDSDDWVHKKMYEELYKTAIKEKCDISMCNMLKVGINKPKKMIQGKLEVKNKTKIIKNYLTGEEQMINEDVCNKIYSSKMLRQNRIKFPENIRSTCEDDIFNLKSIYSAKKISFIDKNHYYYLQHPTSDTHTFKKDNVANMLKSIKLFKQFLSKKNILNKRDFEKFQTLAFNYLISNEKRFSGKIKYTKIMLKQLIKTGNHKKYLSPKESALIKLISENIHLSVMPKILKILIFTEGTILMHKNAKGHSREEIVKQVKDEEESVHDYASYIPICDAAKKLKEWKEQGAELLYLTSRTKPEEINDIKETIKKNKFPDGQLLFRQKDEQYHDVAEKIVPDVLIEDDCESIGGVDEMIITHIKPEIKKRIKSILIKEFSGIDYLPDKISELITRQKI